MRSLLRRWSPAIVTLFVAIELLTVARVAAPQGATTAADASVKPAGAPVTRSVVRTASNGDVALRASATSRLESAQRLLFDARYADAISAFGTTLEHRSAAGTDTVATWAHHGMAIAEAFSGQISRARADYENVLRAPNTPTFALADSIEAAVLTRQHATAKALLDRFADAHGSVLAQQYVHSFRALDRLFASDCAGAVAELKRAPDDGRPLPQAIRGACAARAGHHADAVLLRDSVLTHPLADPNSWPMVIARGVAMRVR